MPKAKEKETNDVQQLLFEPIKGYPMLHWQGKRPFASTQYYPAQLKEQHGDSVDGWLNEIYWGDNLQVMSHLLKKYRGKVNLIYIDPPFDSKADYKKKIELKGRKVANDYNSFEEKQYGDIWTNDEYLQFMYERIIILRELLSNDGSIYIHCDDRKNHHIRDIADEVFGSNNYRNQIIWKRTSAHSDSKYYGDVYDIILYYTKNDNPRWNTLKVLYDDWYIERYYRYKDEDGRLFKSGDLSAKGLSGGGYTYSWKGVEGYWRCPKSTMEKLDNDNKIYYTTNGIPRLKQYLDEMEGLNIQSLWDDILPVVSWSDQTTAYPTQKPEALIERIIKASSNPGDIVFDCFMGSGTTQAVAMKLGRRFIGADINLGAVQITTKRLINTAEEIDKNIAENKEKLIKDENKDSIENYFTGFSIYNVNHYDFFRNPVEAKELLMEALEIQSLPRAAVYDGEKDGFMVKIMPVNRIATRRDLNELIMNVDYKIYDRRKSENPGKPVEKILLVCMGHEPDLAAFLKQEMGDYDIHVEVVDILRDRSKLEFKRDSEAKIKIKKNKLTIEKFYPMNLLQKLSILKQDVKDWRELVESVMIDWNFDDEVFKPETVDVPDKNEMVKGEYVLPAKVKKIKVKITDLLSESFEEVVDNA